MKKIIRLTEADLTRIVRRVIKENDDYKDRSMYDPYYGDDDSYEEDEEWGQTDRGEEELQDLIEEARDILENECEYDLHDLNLMSEYDIVIALKEEGYEELASEIEHLLNQEGFEK
jgi:predicted  nucleic acid-binding Zn-ribbon protein